MTGSLMVGMVSALAGLAGALAAYGIAKWPRAPEEAKPGAVYLIVRDRKVRVPGLDVSTRTREPSWLTVAQTTASLWVDRHFRRKRGLGRPARARPARPACGLTNAAALFLPGADRARYTAEYRSELWDLAQSGAGCLRQLLYAFRQFRAAVPMAFALRSPRRRGAAS
jgi:hypothetical protein